MLNSGRDFRFFSNLVFVLFAVLFFATCTKQVAGPKGEAGVDAKKGNAVIYSSKPFLLDSMAWTKLEVEWFADIYVAEITKKVIEEGEVKVYAQLNGEWVDLPFGEVLNFTRCSFEKGVVHLNHYNTHSAIPTRPTSRLYRVVVLSPVQ